jgi:hypothetical protein
VSGGPPAAGRPGAAANVAVDSASTSGDPSLTQYRAGAG